MSTSHPTRAQRSAELRAGAQARMQRQRQRPLPGWLAAPGRRRALALVPAVIFTFGESPPSSPTPWACSS